MQPGSNQQGCSSELNNENHDEDDLKHLTNIKPSTRENTVSQNKVNEVGPGFFYKDNNLSRLKSNPSSL